MGEPETLKLLEALEIFSGLPPDKLAEMGRLLGRMQAKAGQIIVEEGAVGDCLYIITAGAVSIAKRIPTETEEKIKELATLASGDFFGEMALVEDQVRSARVVAKTDAQLLRLDRKDLFAWLQNQPGMNVPFFKTLVRTLSRRLRSTSRELTMLYDLATTFLEDHPSERSLFIEVVHNVLHYFEGSWSVAGFLFNEFNGDYELVAANGAEAERLQTMPPPAAAAPGGWQDERTLLAALPGALAPKGFLVLVSSRDLPAHLKEEVGRVTDTVARLVYSALLNIQHATEETLKARLKTPMV